MNTSKPVVLYRSEVPSTKGRQFVASALLAVSLGVVSLQAGFVLNASAQNTPNPITSAITSAALVCPDGHIIKIVGGVEVCVGQSQTQEQQNNNQNNNQNNGSTSNGSTNNPVTSPEVSPVPTATPAPVTAPEITPAPTQAPSSNNGNNNGGNSGGGSSNSGGSSAPSCNNEAPKAPRIISAVTTGKNEITLNWEKPASGNVSHYSISYGLFKGKPLYGIANAGNVTSFKVRGLAGGVTYYFTVKAVNDCTPSVSSNEVAMKVGGKFINTPAVGFSSNAVLGKTNQTVKINNSASNKPAVSKPVVFNNEVVNQPKANGGLVGKVVGFFKGLF